VARSDTPPNLRFRSNGTFTIVQFTDIHWHNGEAADFSARALMEQVLDAEGPDLVVLTGDVLGGSEIRDPMLAYREVVRPIEARAIPWAAVFGNHDDEAGVSRLELLDVQRAHPFCLSQRGPENLTGIGNYCVRVNAESGDELAAALYFLDSNSYNELGGGLYDWIRRDQIDWYRETSRRLRAEYALRRSAIAPDGADGRHELPALAFFHIPLPEYNQVWDFETCRGHKYEQVCCPVLNSGFFTALVEAGDVMGCFVGHDHLNDYEGTLSGIRLCYGRVTGYACYGREGFERGARIIRLSAGRRDFTTWLRLADGTVIAEPVEHAPSGRVLSEG
jgi:hypothetical protein